MAAPKTTNKGGLQRWWYWEKRLRKLARCNAGPTFSSGQRIWITSSVNTAGRLAKPSSRNAASDLCRSRPFSESKPSRTSTPSACGFANGSESEDTMSVREIRRPCPADEATVSEWLLHGNTDTSLPPEEEVEGESLEVDFLFTSSAPELPGRVRCQHCGFENPTGGTGPGQCLLCGKPHSF